MDISAIVDELLVVLAIDLVLGAVIAGLFLWLHWSDRRTDRRFEELMRRRPTQESER